MAPVAPKPNKSAKSKSAKPSKSVAQSAASLFAPNKKDKRRIKHAQLLSKITKSQHTKKPRRGRASKKLVATLDALANALPDADDNDDNGAGIAQEQEHVDAQAQAIIRRKSLKSRPGALKRRQKVDQEEMARFSRNMAQLAASAGPVGDAKTAAAPTQKWAALRSFISQTLEKKVAAT